MWHGYMLFRMMIESRTFIHMFAIWSTVVLSFSCYTFFWMFMIVLLIGILCECSVFILQIVPTCFASSWERLLGHVCHTTDKQANPVPNIYIYIYVDTCILDPFKWLECGSMKFENISIWMSAYTDTVYKCTHMYTYTFTQMYIGIHEFEHFKSAYVVLAWPFHVWSF